MASVVRSSLTVVGFLAGGVALSGCFDDSVSFEDVPSFAAAPSDVVANGGGGAGSASVANVASGGRVAAAGGGATGDAGGAVVASVGGGAAAGASSGGSAAGVGHGGGGATGVTIQGAAGAAGAANPTLLLEVIDDVEGPFPRLPARSGRNGAWFAVHDDTGGLAGEALALALEPSRPGSQFAAGMRGSGFTDWGAQLGVSLKSPVVGYDTSAYCGLRFMAKGSGQGWTLGVSDRESSPSGGVCGATCYDDLGTALDVGPEWRTFQIAFDQLTPLSGFSGRQSKLDPSAVFDILFNFESPSGAAFELWVDDLAFVKRSESGCQP